VELLGRDGFGGLGSGYFGPLLYDGKTILIFAIIFILCTMTIVMGGIKGGIERFSKAVMPALGIILVAIIIFVAVQPGAIEGYKFMFQPNTELLSTPRSFFNVLKTAAGQMFFSLSVGMGINITFGSYLPKEKNLQRNAIIVPIADTVFALLAGMMIMPACAAFGVDYGQGPGLLFASMQKVFLDGMGGTVGALIGFLFYFLVFIAAITSSIALLEVCTASIIDRQLDHGKEPKRRKVTLIFAICIFLIAIPVSLDALGSGGASLPAPYELLGFTGDSIKLWNDCWLDFYDMISEGILMPLGALITSILLGWVFPKVVQEECECGGQHYKGAFFFRLCFRVIIPIIMVIVLGTQVSDFFFS
jgi:NSS family neurotransmitter:Na+ symporter